MGVRPENGSADPEVIENDDRGGPLAERGAPGGDVCSDALFSRADRC